MLLLLAFAMLAQRRVLSLINLFAAQGAGARARRRRSSRCGTGPARISTGRPGSRCVLKVLLLPWMLHRLIRRLDVKWDVETLINIPTTMLVGIVLVVFSLQPRAADLAAVEHRDARDAGHRAGLRDAVVPDDDHARARRCRR